MKRIKIEETDSWQKPILSISNNGTATKGNRYIVGDTPTGGFTGLSTNSIVVYDGTAWLEDVPSEGWQTYNVDTGLYIYFDGVNWILVPSGSAESGVSGSVSYAEVSNVSNLFALSPNNGDWAYVSATNHFYIYLGTYWRDAGTFNTISDNNDYGEAFHLDAGNLALSDNDNVTTWADESGNGFDATAPSTGPVFKTSIINGLPVVRFSGNVNERLQILGKVFANGVTDKMTIIAVMKSSTSTTNTLLSTRPSAGSFGWSFKYFTAATNIIYSHTGYSYGAITVTDQFNVVWARRNSASDANGGVNSNSDIMSGDPTNFGISPDAYTQLGTEVDGASAPFNGDVAEIYIFEDAIGDSLLGTIIADLKTKYNIA